MRERKNIEGKKGIKREKKPTGYFGNRWVLITFLKEAMVETPLVNSHGREFVPEVRG